jgi:simple sugar transport system permease protein
VLDQVFIVGLLASALRFAAPLMFAALGETVAQRAGVLNVGLEGIMLVGAFLAALGSWWTGSPWGGLVLAILGGAAMAGLHAFLSITLRADQIISGIAMIVLGLGISGYGFRLTLGAMSPPPTIPAFAPLKLWGLAELPIIGPVLLGQHLLLYLALASAVVLQFVQYRTRWGLDIRAVGESPEAADAAGLRVHLTRYWSVIFGGMMAAVGGAYLSTAQLSGFVENMVSGRGFIAIACVVFGRWSPLGAMAAALFFGAAEAAQVRLQVLNPDIPFQFFVMMPYLLAVIFLIFLARRSRMPAALGIPFAPPR